MLLSLQLSPTLKPLGYRSCQGEATNHIVIVIDTGLEPALDDLTTFRSWGFGHHPALRSRSFAEK